MKFATCIRNNRIFIGLVIENDTAVIDLNKAEQICLGLFCASGKYVGVH